MFKALENSLSQRQSELEIMLSFKKIQSNVEVRYYIVRLMEVVKVEYIKPNKLCVTELLELISSVKRIIAGSLLE